MSSTMDCESVIEAIDAVLARQPVRAAIERLLVAGERGRIGQAVERMRRKTAYITVLGLQGSGKSSLLNSVLFTARTLPIGEGTTTNVICFVRGAADGEPRGEVSFLGRPPLRIPLSMERLAEYMDERLNPENRLDVTSVTAFTTHELLTNNTVFVDTPGLQAFVPRAYATTGPAGSHDSITMGFVQDISLGIYVLRTTPPIRRHEADSISDLWRLCPELVFVQNVWSESDEDIAASERHNAETLARIARSHGDLRPISILRVNIHEALEGAVNGWPGSVEHSGAPALQRLLQERVTRGGRWLEIGVQGRQIVHALHAAAVQGAKEAAAAATPADDHTARQRERQLLEAQEKINNLTRRHRQRVAEFRRQCTDIVTDARRSLELGVERARADLIDRGDPGDLTQRMQSRFKRAAAESIDEFTGRLANTCDLFLVGAVETIEEIGQTVSLSPRDVAGAEADVFGTYLMEWTGGATVWGSTITLTALTSISAMAFGSALTAGSTVTAAVVAAGTAVPGPGWIIAGVALVVGATAKQLAKEKRQREIVRVISEAADSVLEQTKAALSAEAERIRDRVAGHVEEYVKGSVAQQEQLLAELRAMQQLSQAERSGLGAELTAMVAELTQAATEIERLANVAEPAASA